ncbi:uncharacterized protein LOC116016705 [Ipomoea triloba]|uniref:uncharacterized protein LOC116016705 n=1 Tax=Ipomoea triloba TaxID=35885 RepID=UPI00125DF3B9|nr:uncharacterized protein LOC116016705 [Ipomoea triloba]
MLAVQEIIRDGCRRCIGDGLDTEIGSDAWLPTDSNPYIQTVLHDSIANAPVDSLMNDQANGNHMIRGLGIGITRVSTQSNLATDVCRIKFRMTGRGLKFGLCIFLQRLIASELESGERTHLCVEPQNPRGEVEEALTWKIKNEHGCGDKF